MTDAATRTNPFEVTKAVDFSDEEIVRTWVDLPGGGFYRLANPNSRTSVVLLGGKGSGRTHLMRYFSAVSQKIRNPGLVTEALIRDGYLGLYVRCSGLNSGRFEGKGQTEEAWADVFAYYTDLWLAQHVLGTVSDLIGESAEFKAAETRIVERTTSLFDLPPIVAGADVSALLRALHDLQREIDIAVNNAAISRELPATIRATRGTLVFDLPAVLTSEIETLRSVQMTYLLDELENLTAAQQKYVNTLVREKRPPCGFMIGSRLYGIRTRETYASGEENKEGSEYESVYLDRIYLREKDQYGKFCREVVAHRLADAGYIPPPSTEILSNLSQYFEEIGDDRFGTQEVEFVLARSDSERVCLSRLRQKLRDGFARGRVPGLSAEHEIDGVVDALAVPDFPLVEKLNTFLFYQDWFRKRNLVEAAEKISGASKSYIHGESKGRHHTQMGLFKADLVAQTLREYNQKQRYFGLGTFIHMSSGLPRNLVIILKNVFRWAVFDGEEPFGSSPISLAAQREGILQSSNWFYEDAPGVGELGREAQGSVDLVAGLMRSLRFADKPVESSLSAFSVNLNSLTDRARATIRAAEQWSMLMPVDEGQRDKNSGAVLAKYQLSGMLAPRWDLPIYRRGTLALTLSEANAIFDVTYRVEYDGLVRTRLGRLNAPFFGARESTGDLDIEDPDARLFE